MATWATISKDSLRSAQLLHRNGRARSAASRAYFAAYAAVASNLPEGMTFAGDRPNPGHANMPSLVKSNLTTNLGPGEARDAVRIIRMLQSSRVASDCDRQATVDDVTSLQCVREAARFLDLLEVT